MSESFIKLNKFLEALVQAEKAKFGQGSFKELELERKGIIIFTMKSLFINY